jgi:uncharacterized protein YuzE
MDPLRILEGHEELEWAYDDEADVLYISIGAPRPSVTLDLGDGILARYDDKTKKVLGISVLGFRSRLLESLKKEAV